MKDYIDKLREDYHRKQIKKLKFGDKIKAKYNDWKYGTVGSPEIEVGADGKDIPKVITGPSLTTLNPSLTQGKDGKPSLFTNSQMGLGNQDKDVIYSPDYEKKGKELEKSQEDLKNMFTNPGQESTYDGKKAPSFIKEGEKTQEKPKEQQQPPGFFAPPNGDLTTNLYNLGRAIGTKPGTSGRGLAIASNTGAAALEGARALFSGVGFSKAQGYTDQYNQEQMLAARKKYESNPQYGNANYMGGPTQTRNGGRINHFEEGGEQQQMDPRMQQMMAQQQQQPQQGMQEQADPRMQQAMAQEGQQQMDPRMQQQQQQQEPQMNEQEAQAYQQIAEKLVNSFETIEEIANYLKENEVDEAAYNAILRFAEEMLEDKDESADDNEEATEEPEEKEEMRKGGKKFNKKVGEYIEFEYGGKTYKGTIKSIKNGQIFLK